MKVGGKRPGAGRPKGSRTKITEYREMAAAAGELPSAFLLRIARGEPVQQMIQGRDGDWVEETIYPDLATRIDCAKAAAPFFEPRLQAQTISLTPDGTDFSDALKTLAEKLPG